MFSRRSFIQSSVCGAHMLALAQFNPHLTRRIFQQDEDKNIVVKENCGYIQKLSEGVWALVSTPFDNKDFTTVCNSGIIAGKDRVVVVEAFMQPKGAQWMSEQAFKLTGKRPTDIICTHFHGDHTAGHAGFEHEKQNPNIWLTPFTRKSASASLKKQKGNSEFKNVKLLSANQPTKIDLGGKTVTVHPRSGHTDSDVTIEITDPNIVWCGDLFFNRMYPNYGDAKPRQLNEFADKLVRSTDTLYVPGHGPVADAAALTAYRDFLKFVEAAATNSFKSGKAAVEGAKSFELPESLKDWLVWSDDVVIRSYNAWYKTLKAEQTKKQ